MGDFDRYAASGEINSEVADTDVVLARIRSRYADRADVELDELDGLSGTHADWGFNVRRVEHRAPAPAQRRGHRPCHHGTHPRRAAQADQE